MRQLLPWLLLVSVVAACQPAGSEVPATQLILRVTAAAEVKSQLQSLRLRTAKLQGDRWGVRFEREFDIAVLKWPVDLVAVAAEPDNAGSALEIIVEALDSAGNPLAQARALTSFLRRQSRILTLTLERCGTMPLGQLCEADPQCLGPSCHTCVDGLCANTPVIDPNSLTAEPVDAGAMVEPATAADAGGGGGQLDATVVAPGLDAGLEAGSDAGAEWAEATVSTEAGSLEAALTCPAGSQPSGTECVDIDECTAGTSPCVANAMCVNRTGGYDCRCNPGYDDVKGDASECRDPCLGACDPIASCSAVEGAPRCTCPPAYTTSDNGKTCVFDASCSLLNCSANATCKNSGGARQCECNAGYRGNGTTCTNINECSETPGICGTNSTCTDTQGAYTCGCQSGYRRVNNMCQKLPCSPNPCLNGGTCSENSSGQAVCACGNTGYDGPTCAHNIDDCVLRPCANSVSCTDGVRTRTCNCMTGYSGAECDTRICMGPITINNTSLLASYADCSEVRGDLTIGVGGFATIDTNHFTKLTRITGNLTFSAFLASGSTQLRTATMDKLESVGGSVSASTGSSETVFRFPRLRTIGGDLTISAGRARGVIAPALTSIANLSVQDDNSTLCTLDLPVARITGTLMLWYIANVPASAVSGLRQRAAATDLTDIGCCYVTDNLNCQGEVPAGPPWCGGC